MGLGRFLVSFGLLAALSAGAEAKEEKGKGGRKDRTGIEPTGIEAFDEVFARVGAIDERLTSAESELRTGKRNLNTALELEKGTPLADGLAELQARAGDQLQLTLEQGAVPKLTVKDAVPSNVQSAVDAVNGLTANITTSLTDIEGLLPEIEGLVGEVGDMPARLKDEFQGGSADLLDLLFQLPKTSKALKQDIDVTLGLADRSTALTGRMTELLDVVSSEFGGSGGGKKPAGKGGGKKGDRG